MPDKLFVLAFEDGSHEIFEREGRLLDIDSNGAWIESNGEVFVGPIAYLRLFSDEDAYRYHLDLACRLTSRRLSARG